MASNRLFLSPEIGPPCIERSVLEVVRVGGIGISLAFEGDIDVSMLSHAEPDEPFDDIPQVEPNEKHLEHLCPMDAFMADEPVGDDCFGPAYEHSQEIDGSELLWREVSAAEDFHSV